MPFDDTIIPHPYTPFNCRSVSLSAPLIAKEINWREIAVQSPSWRAAKSNRPRSLFFGNDFERYFNKAGGFLEKVIVKKGRITLAVFKSCKLLRPGSESLSCKWKSKDSHCSLENDRRQLARWECVDSH